MMRKSIHFLEQPSFKLDDLYEAKAYKWMFENVDTGTGTNVFWCVGRRLSPNEVCNIKMVVYNEICR